MANVETHTHRTILALPYNASDKNLVTLESRKGTCILLNNNLLLESLESIFPYFSACANILIHFPNVVISLLIRLAS